MARAFAAASTEYLGVSSAPVTAPPFTIAAWAWTNAALQVRTILSIGDTDTTAYYSLRFDDDGSIDAFIYDGSSSSDADTTGSYAANTWHHCAAVFAAVNDKRAYRDGGNKGTSGTNLPIGVTVDQTKIGVTADSTPNYYLDGRVAEPAIWNVALTDAEILVLSLGISPLLVRPANLVAYWPLLRDTDQDLVGGYDLTAYNTPTVADHPPIVHYPLPSFPYLPASAPPIMPDPRTLHQGTLFSGPGLGGGNPNPLHAYAGRLQKVMVIHSQATVQTVTFYDATSVPAPADNEILVLHVDPAQSPYFVSFPQDGIPFNTGLSLAGANCDVHVWSLDHG